MIWIGLLGALAWLAALGSWGYQAYWWIQHGYWKPLPLAGLIVCRLLAQPLPQETRPHPF